MSEAELLELARKIATHLPAKSGQGKHANRSVRQRVKRRDGHKCVLCGTTANLTVHHIKPKREGGSNKMRNLRTLCDACHSAHHQREKSKTSSPSTE